MTATTESTCLAEIELPQARDEPVFAAPWEAQAFALLMLLHQDKYFPWQEWVVTFSGELKTAETSRDFNRSYYEVWSVALERIVNSCGLVDSTAIDERMEMWRRAYLATPHGQEVRLENAQQSNP